MLHKTKDIAKLAEYEWANQSFYWTLNEETLLTAAAQGETHSGGLGTSKSSSVVRCNLSGAGGVGQESCAAVHAVAVGHVSVLGVGGGREVEHCSWIISSEMYFKVAGKCFFNLNASHVTIMRIGTAVCGGASAPIHIARSRGKRHPSAVPMAILRHLIQARGSLQEISTKNSLHHTL